MSYSSTLDESQTTNGRTSASLIDDTRRLAEAHDATIASALNRGERRMTKKKLQIVPATKREWRLLLRNCALDVAIIVLAYLLWLSR